MTASGVAIYPRDNFGRRSGLDRRSMRSKWAGDERRKVTERRQQNDRRESDDRRVQSERRFGDIEIPEMFLSTGETDHPVSTREDPVALEKTDRRAGRQRRSGVDRRDFLIL